MHSKGNQKQNEKIIHRMEANICKQFTNKRLIKQLMQLNIKKKKKNSPMKKWAEDLNRHFKYTEMAKKHMKKMLNISNY